MSSQIRRAAFFDVDNTLVRGSTIYFLGRGMYQRGFFTKADISRFVLANLRFRLTGTEKQDEINRFQQSAQDFIGGHTTSLRSAQLLKKFMTNMYRLLFGKERSISLKRI